MKRSAGNSEDDLLALVGAIYEAALDRSAWRSVLSCVAEATGSVSVAIVLPARGPRGGASPIGEPITLGVDPAFGQQLAQYYWQHQPWIARMSPRDLGTPLPGRAVVPLDELRQTEFYNDCWARQGFLDSFSVSLRFAHGRLVSDLSGTRRKEDPQYSDADLDVLRPLVPHLQRALEIDARLSKSGEERDSLVEALDRLPLAVLITNGTGQVVSANRSAERLLNAADGLYAPRGVLSAAARSRTQSLLRMIAEAAQPQLRLDPAAGGGGWLPLERPSGRRDLAALVAPLGEKGSGELRARGLVLVFISDPDSQVELPREALQRLWKLTGAESELALRLVNGCSLEQACEVIGVTRNTAKTQLARIFSKTGTHRQGELVGLLARTVGALAQA